MSNESVAAIAVALATAMEAHHPGITESFRREAERLFRIISDKVPEENRSSYEGGLMAVEYLLGKVQAVKLEGDYDVYDTYPG